MHADVVCRLALSCVTQRVTQGAPVHAGFAVRAAAAVPLLLAAYGATMSRADRALLTALQEIDGMASWESGARPLTSARCATLCLDAGNAPSHAGSQHWLPLPDELTLPTSLPVCSIGTSIQWLAFCHMPASAWHLRGRSSALQRSGTCGAGWHGRPTAAACCCRPPLRAAPAPDSGRCVPC